MVTNDVKRLNSDASLEEVVQVLMPYARKQREAIDLLEQLARLLQELSEGLTLDKNDPLLASTGFSELGRHLIERLYRIGLDDLRALVSDADLFDGVVSSADRQVRPPPYRA